jgi:hypothetical protein
MMEALDRQPDPLVPETMRRVLELERSPTIEPLTAAQVLLFARAAASPRDERVAACGCRNLESTTVAGDLPSYATVTPAAMMAEVCREHAWFGEVRRLSGVHEFDPAAN